MLQTYWEIFLAFFIPNIVGYGGGPAIIPLIEAQVVGHYAWMDAAEFAQVLALGNALPSPIATKMAGYIGYEVGGILGAVIAVFATVAPSLIIMVVALGVLYRYRNTKKVKALSQWVLPVISVMMLLLTVKLFQQGGLIAWPHFIGLFAVAAVLFEKVKLPPTAIICMGLAYGALFL